MDAERYYENRRLAAEAENDEFEQIKQEKYDEYAKEIRQLVGDGFRGSPVRLPRVEDGEIKYRLQLKDAVAEYIAFDDGASDALTKAFATDEGKYAFYAAVAEYYVDWQCDSLAEVAAEDEMKGEGL